MMKLIFGAFAQVKAMHKHVEDIDPWFSNQAVIFSGDIGEDGGPRCIANFVPGWGVHAYVTWFAVSSFFVPLLFLVSIVIKTNIQIVYHKNTIFKTYLNEM
jgi:hypothetical protein